MLFVPTERRPGVAAILRERFEIPGCVGEFEGAREYPVA